MSTKTTTLSSPGAAGRAFLQDISADGRYLLYYEPAFGNLTGTITLRDLQTGGTQVVASGVVDVDLSEDGRLVAYSNGNPAGAAGELHIWDRTTGAARLLASTPDTSGFAADGFFELEISPDNNHVFFVSGSRTLLVDTDDQSDQDDLYRINVQSGAIEQIAEKTSELFVSAGGRYIVTTTAIPVPNAVALQSEDFKRLDLLTGATVPIGPGNTFLDDNMYGVSLSGDGQRAVFTSYEDLVPADTNGKSDIYLLDFTTGSLSVVSRSTSGAVGNASSRDGVISADGTRVVFNTEASNLSPGAGPTGETTIYHVVVKDLPSGIISTVAVRGGDSETLTAIGGTNLDISADGLAIGLNSTVALVAGDSDSLSDAYLVRYFPPAITIEAVSGDNFVGAAEVDGPVVVRGTSPGIGQLVFVTAPSGDSLFTTVGGDATWSVTFEDLSGVPDGTRVFTAATLDDAGVRGETSKNVVFDRTGPTIVMSPVAGDNIVNAAEAASFQVSGTSDAIGQLLALSIDGEFVGSTTVGPTGAWSQSFNFAARPDGTYEIGASVADPSGNRASAVRDVTLDKTPPSIDILSVAGDNVVSASEIEGLVAVRGTSDAIGRTVTITAGNVVRGTAVVQTDGTWQADVSLHGASGEVIVFAVVEDAVGNRGADSEFALVESNIIRVSTNSDGSQGAFDPDSHSGRDGYDAPSLSADGRFVAFESWAYGFGPGDDAESYIDIYVKDVRTGAITRISKPLDGEVTDGVSLAPSISADGRFVAFFSFSSKLVEGDTNAAPDIFVVDLATGVVERVSTNAEGEEADRGTADDPPGISADGRLVVFVSDSTNLVDGADSIGARLYVKDRQTGEIELVSFNEPESVIGTLPHSDIGGGRFIAFQSTKSAGAGDPDGDSDIFVRDLVTGSVELVSATPSGVAANGDSTQPEMSADGRFVAFFSGATDLVSGPTPSQGQIYLRDLESGITRLVSALPDGTPMGAIASYGSPSISLSTDGRYVTFATIASGVPEDGGIDFDVYLKDMQTGALTVVSSGTRGYDITDALEGSLNADGRYVAFSALASDLVRDDTNGVNDIFLRRLIPHTLTLDPIAGDDRVEPVEASAALPVSGTSSVIGGTVTIRADGLDLGSAVVQADGTWATTIDILPLSAGNHSVRATVLDGPGFASSDGAILEILPRIGITSGDAASVAENSAAATVVYQTIATQANAALALVYSLSGADAALFRISSAGAITFLTPADFETPADAGANNVYDLVVTVEDGENPSASRAVAITVSNINEAPTDIGLTAGPVAENAPSGTLVGFLSGVDPDAGDTLTFSLIADAGGAFELAGNELRVADGSLFDADVSNRASITVRVTDAAGATLDKVFSIIVASDVPGTEGPDVIIGTADPDVLSGLGDRDTLSGEAGDDVLEGGPGADVLLGGTGNDIYLVDDTFDLVDEGGAFPDFAGSAFDFDTIISTADWFWDVYSVAERLVIAEDAVDADFPGTTIIGSAFSNEMVGNSLENYLFGRGGSDVYRPGAGIDTISFSTLGLTEENAYADVDGVNTLVAEAGNSYDIVYEFEIGKDKIDVTDFGYASAEAVLDLGFDDGLGNSFFALGDGFDYVYLIGVELAEVTAVDFIV